MTFLLLLTPLKFIGAVDRQALLPHAHSNAWANDCSFLPSPVRKWSDLLAFATNTKKQVAGATELESSGPGMRVSEDRADPGLRGFTSLAWTSQLFLWKHWEIWRVGRSNWSEIHLVWNECSVCGVTAACPGALSGASTKALPGSRCCTSSSM